MIFEKELCEKVEEIRAMLSIGELNTISKVIEDGNRLKFKVYGPDRELLSKELKKWLRVNCDSVISVSSYVNNGEQETVISYSNRVY